jgi:hypothetical protein
MELNITTFFNEGDMTRYSASQAELGDNAGNITWQNAKIKAEEATWLDTEEKREELRRYLKTFGAWDDAEILAWSDIELSALLIQLIAGDIRESGLQEGGSWADYNAMSDAGQVDGRLCMGEDGEVYYYVGE